nr:DUF2513 domain-containing protein [uncultured Cohaesibacter sp.]
MQRNFEIIREILEDLDARPANSKSPIKLDSYKPEDVEYNVKLLYEEGFVKGSVYSVFSSPFEVSNPELSWNGHDLLNLLRNETLWNRLKKLFSSNEMATLPLAALLNAGSEQVFNMLLE